jgi:predicted DNA-binding transcriptional regulator YafY
MPPHDRPHRPHGPHHGRGPAFLDRARLDELLVPLVPDAGDRDFVARCLVAEGPAHHRGANFILVSLLGRLLERLPGEDAGGGGARVPMRLPPHLQDELEVSPATLKRDLEYLRSRMGAPIEYDRDVNGYRFGRASAGPRHELPGLWFDESELHALLTAQQLLAGLDSEGLLSRHLQPLLDRIQHLLASGGGTEAAERINQRVKIVTALRRPVPSRFFERVSAALLSRRRLRLRYLTRGRAVSERTPAQRLVHYRNTWYLDAWCHRATALRRFALDAVQQAQVLDSAAQEVPMSQVQAEMDGGYGIYAGGEQRWATLVFNPQAAQWASREEWHPEQRGRWLDDGSYELRLPYVDDTELVMDVLRQGDQVRVVAPPELIRTVARRLAAAAGLYPAS